MLGGDGTINEVVNGMAHSSAVLGVLPGGTANVFAMETGLGSRLDRAAHRLVECVEQRIALGRFTNAQGTRYFLLMGGVGLDASIVIDVNSELKAKTGKFAYWVAGLGRTFARVDEFDASVAHLASTLGDAASQNGLARNGTSDGHTRKRSGFTLISRVRNYGGDMEIAHSASLLRDDFHVVMMEGSNPLRYATYLAAVGARCLRLLPGVTDVHSEAVECGASAPVQLDGEYVGRTPGRFEIEKNALSLLLPSGYR